MTRETTVTRTQAAVAGGGTIDFTTIYVEVYGGRLEQPVARTLVMGAP